MAVASSETDRWEEQKGLRKEDAQCRLEKKSRATTEVQSLLSGESSHSRLPGPSFSLFSFTIPPPERVPLAFVDIGMNARLPLLDNPVFHTDRTRTWN